MPTAQIRWLNSKKEGNNINSESQALELVSRIKFDRATPLGTSLRDKILEPLVYKKVKKNTLKKPALIVIITDGAPTGEPRDKIVKVIQESKAILGKTPYTPDAVSFQLAQVGNDAEARDFLEWIDKHPQIGSLVECVLSRGLGSAARAALTRGPSLSSCTSNYEQECDDMAKGNPPCAFSLSPLARFALTHLPCSVHLTPTLWLAKLVRFRTPSGFV